MTDIDDRLAALISNAQLLHDYNSETGVLEASDVGEALEAFKTAPAPNYYSAETERLRREVSRLVAAIKPTTISDLRGFFPYTTTKKKNFRRSLYSIFMVFFAVFSLVLIMACGYYTLWSKSASQYMNAVQLESNRLASESLREILTKWDGPDLPPGNQKTGGAIEAGSTATRIDVDPNDFRVYHTFYGAFATLKERRDQLQIQLDTPFVCASFAVRRIWKSITWSSEKTSGTCIWFSAPPTNLQSGWGPPTTGKAELTTTGKAGLPTSTPEGRGYGMDSTVQCIQKLEEKVVKYKADLEATWKDVGPRYEHAFVAFLTQYMHHQLYACYYRPDSIRNTVNTDTMREQYLTNIRVTRDQVDVINSWVLPGLYGAMGAVILTLRMLINPITPRPQLTFTIIRTLLGAFVGVIVGWFWSPQSNQFFDFANISLGLFTMAFLMGYGSWIFFDIVDRLLSFVSQTFNKREKAG